MTHELNNKEYRAGYVDGVNALTNRLIDYFTEHAHEVWDHVSARDFVCDNIEVISEKLTAPDNSPNI